MSDDKKNGKHKMVVVQVGDRREEIDEALAPLIREIWVAGIATIMSCQGTEPGLAWIEFETVEDLLSLLNIVAVFEGGEGSLYSRINALRGPFSDSAWVYQLNVEDWGSLIDDDEFSGMPDFHATVGLYFPREDIHQVLKCMNWYNRSKKRPAAHS